MSKVVLLIVLPLMTAFLLPVIHRVSPFAGRWMGPAVLLLTSVMGILLWSELGHGAIAIEIGGFRPPLGITLYVDQLALLLALAVTVGTLLLWPGGG